MVDAAANVRSTFTNAQAFVTPQHVAAVRAANRSLTTAWTYPELAASVPVLMPQQASWKATASHESDRAVRAFGTAGWSTVVPQAAGMWFQFELPAPVMLAELRFLSAGEYSPPGQPPHPTTHPRGYRVQVSMDGVSWSESVAEGVGGGRATTIVLPAPVRARFVRITQTGAAEN